MPFAYAAALSAARFTATMISMFFAFSLFDAMPFAGCLLALLSYAACYACRHSYDAADTPYAAAGYAMPDVAAAIAAACCCHYMPRC